MTDQQTAVAEGLSQDALIGRRVHHLMWDRQMSQKAFGLKLGMDQSTVAKKLRGTVGWSTTQLVIAARELGVTVGYLFGEGDLRPVPPVKSDPSDYLAPVTRLRFAA